METQLLSISKIFTEKLYRIPDYQRGYAWNERQLKDFWNDITQLEEGKNHYVGVLTLEKVLPETYNNWEDDTWIINSKSFEPYFIVDGQQRLTTTILLIQAITESVPETSRLNYNSILTIKNRYIFDSKDEGISRSYIFGYEKDNPSYEYLKTKIFNEDSSGSYLNEETIYTQNLIFAKLFFIERLKELQLEQIENVFKKITQHFLFNIYSITQDIDVFVAFETMNNRGKPLSVLELLKNRLIYLSTKFHVAETEKKQLRKHINDSWKAVYHYLGKNKDNPLNDDTFLINHLLVYFGEITDDGQIYSLRSRNQIMTYKKYYETFLLEEIFSLKRLQQVGKRGRPKLTIRDINKYILSLQNSVTIWYDLHNLPTPSSIVTEAERIIINKLSRIGFPKFNTLLLSVYLKKPSEALTIEFLNSLERFGFIGMLPTNRYGMHLHVLNELALKLGQGKIDQQEVNLHLNKYIEKMSYPDADVIGELSRLFKSTGFYEWIGIRYFLYEYDLNFRDSSKSKRIKIDWAQFNLESEDYITIEHIYPQTANTECWKENFNSYSNPQKKLMLNSLGNLLPLSKPKNSSLQNKCFAEKVDNSKKVGYRYGSYSENEVSKEETWTPNHIFERGIKLLEFMESRWQINLGDRSDKIKILNLSFLDLNGEQY